MAIRYQKRDAMAASASTQQCGQLKLCIVIDDAVAKDLGDSFDGLIRIRHLALPSASSSRDAVSKTYQAA